MERTSRKPSSSTADLLTWTEAPPEGSPAAAGAAARIPPIQAKGSVAAVVFGGQMSEEEKEELEKRKICSGSKWKEMTGSGIFSAQSEADDSESGDSFSTPNNRTGLRMYQQAVNAVSQISFSGDESVSPKKPISLAEVAKQRELSGNLESETDSQTKKQLSDAKSKELSGSDIFGPPSEVPRRALAARHLRHNVDIGEPVPRSIHTSVKVSNPAGGPSNIMFSEEPVSGTSKKIHNQKVVELTGNDIFKGDSSPGSSEKQLSNAKLKEMSGNDIFADGKSSSRDYYGGVRKPPGGESSIALV